MMNQQMPGVTVYADAHYAGASQTLAAGWYDLERLREVGDDAISSLKVPDGWRVTLYEHAGFRGRCRTVYGDSPDLRGFDDLASSLVVAAGPGRPRPTLADALALPGTPSGALCGFDMLWRLSASTINAQLAWLHAHGHLPGTLRFGELERDGMAIGGDGADRASMAAPTLELATEEARTARLSLTFTGGQVSYYPGPSAAGPVRCPLAGWRLVFSVPLKLGSLAPGQWQRGVPATVAAQLGSYDPAGFSVEAVFLDVRDCGLGQYDPVRSQFEHGDGWFRQKFAAMLGGWLRSLHGADNPFVLAYPVLRKAPPDQQRAVFEPTGASLPHHARVSRLDGAEHGEDAAGGLELLLVSGYRRLGDPAARHSCAGDACQFRPESGFGPGVAGKAIVARDVFMKHFLLPTLVLPLEFNINALPDYLDARRDRSARASSNSKSGVAGEAGGERARFVPTANGWEYHDRVFLEWHESGTHSHDRQSEQDRRFQIGLASQPDADGIARLTLELSGTLMRYEWDQLNVGIFAEDHVYVGRAWARATLRWRLRLQFMAGADGQLAMVCVGGAEPPVVEHGISGIYKDGDIYSDLLGLPAISEDWRDNAISLAEVQQRLVPALIAQLTPALEAAAARIVLPAAPRLRIGQIGLNADGDIELDVRCPQAT